MKFLTIMSIILSSANSYATAFTSDFAISCNGKIKLEVVSSFYKLGKLCSYDSHPISTLKSVRHCGRSLPSPASGGVKVIATVVDNGGYYCHAFEEKMGVSLYQYSFPSVFHLKEVSPDAVKKLKGELDGATVPFTIDQSFRFNVGTLLPLYPYIMEETLNFKAKLKNKASLSYFIQVDSKKAYGLPRIKDADDQTKLNAVDKILEFNIEREMNAPKKRSVAYFNNLITELEPSGIAAKDEYAKKLVEYIDFVASKKYTPTFFFNINIGGSSGADIANKLYQLNLDEDLVQHIISRYPYFILGTSIVAINVFKMNSVMLEEVMQGYIDVANKTEKHTSQEYRMLKNAAKVAYKINNPNSLNVFGRSPELVSQKLIALSNQLLIILK